MPRINPNNRDFISLLSDFLQFYNTNLLQEDASNNDVIKELQHQNKDYLEKIINQNKEYFERIILMFNNIAKRLDYLDERIENDVRRNDERS